MGRVLLSVTEDTCGWHDPIGGHTTEALVRAKPPGVTMWAMRYVTNQGQWAGHVIYCTMSKGAVIYQDTNGVFYTSANAVASAFPSVQVVAGAPITYIPNATLIPREKPDRRRRPWRIEGFLSVILLPAFPNHTSAQHRRCSLLTSH